MPTSKQHLKSKTIAKRRRPSMPRNMERQRENHARETREWIYLFIVLNCFWFTGDLPDHPAIPFTLLVNPNWPKPYELPQHLHALGNLSEFPAALHLQAIEDTGLDHQTGCGAEPHDPEQFASLDWSGSPDGCFHTAQLI